MSEMEITAKDLFDWLKGRYPDHLVCTNPVFGTYGLVWFLNRSVDSFAVKTLDPERISVEASRLDGEYLRREFRMWLALPHTYNVLPALGFDVAELGVSREREFIKLPVMRMPRRLGSLQDWVGSKSYSYEDRLVALAQAFNGLLFLYANGIEGHGDLKPSNILYDDLRSFSLPEASGVWPSAHCPWRIQVADLGWANAWVDLGFTDKAQRQYLAPERIDGEFVPIASDMFSMGIIAAEVLQGRHPCPKLSKAGQSHGKWRHWVEKGDRDLSDVASEPLKEMILQCLQPNACARPAPTNCLKELCDEIERVFGYSVNATLELWRRPLAGDGLTALDEHFAWASAESMKLNEEQASISKDHLSNRLKEISANDFEACERWIVLAEGLEKLSTVDATEEYLPAQLREEARYYLTTVLGQLTSVEVRMTLPRSELPKLIRPFERFSELIARMARLAGVEYHEAQRLNLGLGEYALSALAFGAASEAYALGFSIEVQRGFLGASIRHAPNEAVPYYFRARWGYDTAWVQSVASENAIPLEDRQSWVADLESALKLDPTWVEPARLLESIARDC